MQKSIWIFGSIAGIIGALLEYLFYSNHGIDLKAMYIGKIAALIICIIFALILIRKITGGTISIARTLFSGVLIAIIRSAIMIGVFTFLHYPDGKFYESRLQEALAQTEAKIQNDESVEPAKKEKAIRDAQYDIKSQYTPFKYGVFALFGSMITGFVISVLMAAFISTNMMHQQE